MSTPLAVGAVIATAILGVPLIHAGAALEKRHHAAGAADAAALAAADALLGWIDEEPCTMARLTASVAEAEVILCQVKMSEVLVTVSVPGLFGSITMNARAGVELADE